MSASVVTTVRPASAMNMYGRELDSNSRKEEGVDSRRTDGTAHGQQQHDQNEQQRAAALAGANLEQGGKCRSH